MSSCLAGPAPEKTHISVSYGVLAAQRGSSVRFSVRSYKAAALLADLYATLADGSKDWLIRKLARFEILIIDDLRHVPVRPEYATLLFDLVDARHLQESTVVSSNLSVKAWGKLLGNPALTASMLDRLMEQAHVINIAKGRSYRVEGPAASPQRPQQLDDEDTD